MIFKNLIVLMALIGVNKKELANIINKAPSAVTDKLEGKTEFKLSEMQSIQEYFVENKDSFDDPNINLSLDYIFYRSGNYSYPMSKGA